MEPPRRVPEPRRLTAARPTPLATSTAHSAADPRSTRRNPPAGWSRTLPRERDSPLLPETGLVAIGWLARDLSRVRIAIAVSPVRTMWCPTERYPPVGPSHTSPNGWTSNRQKCRTTPCTAKARSGHRACQSLLLSKLLTRELLDQLRRGMKIAKNGYFSAERNDASAARVSDTKTWFASPQVTYTPASFSEAK